MPFVEPVNMIDIKCYLLNKHDYIHIRQEKTQKFILMAETFLQRNLIDPLTHNYMFNGEKINLNRTPNDYNMKNNDEIFIVKNNYNSNF